MRRLARLRKRLRERGLRLMLDFVPNHMALDHPWIDDHPDYFIAGSEQDLARQRLRVEPTVEKLRAALEGLYDLPIVGDVRGAGFFYGIELVKDKTTRETFSSEESERLLRGFLSPALFDAGLVCRTDDRGDPVVQLAPPLICEQEHFDLIAQILRDVLGQAMSRI